MRIRGSGFYIPHGDHNGGIAAIFDYLPWRLSEYSSNSQPVEWGFLRTGFAFVRQPVVGSIVFVFAVHYHSELGWRKIHAHDFADIAVIGNQAR